MLANRPNESLPHLEKWRNIAHAKSGRWESSCWNYSSQPDRSDKILSLRKHPLQMGPRTEMLCPAPLSRARYSITVDSQGGGRVGIWFFFPNFPAPKVTGGSNRERGCRPYVFPTSLPGPFIWVPLRPVRPRPLSPFVLRTLRLRVGICTVSKSRSPPPPRNGTQNPR